MAMKARNNLKPRAVRSRGGDRSAKQMTTSLSALGAELALLGRNFSTRGWVLGTSGNFSAVLSREPMRLAITSTGLDKGTLMPEHFLEVDDSAKVLTGEGKPSAEALLHIAIVRGLAAGGVLHT